MKNVNINILFYHYWTASHYTGVHTQAVQVCSLYSSLHFVSAGGGHKNTLHGSAYLWKKNTTDKLHFICEAQLCWCPIQQSSQIWEQDVLLFLTVKLDRHLGRGYLI